MKCPVCKKNISESTIKCPYCKSRTGLLCGNCKHVNPIGTLKCEQCGQELLKVCKNCGSVNFPSAQKCRKCASPFGPDLSKKKKKKIIVNELMYNPKLYSINNAAETLSEGILDPDKKLFSVSGPKGLGKSSVLKKAIISLEPHKFQWCIGKCSPLTQLSPGGVIQNMLLSLFKLPNYCLNNEELQKNVFEFFSKEFSFLNPSEVMDFLNFIYNFRDGDYEDIIINKRRTYDILNSIFDAFIQTGRFIFVVDNFDFIDGFSVEFLTEFIQREKNWKNLKFIATYNDYRPISAFFPLEEKKMKAYEDISLHPIKDEELEKVFDKSFGAKGYISEREKENIFEKSKGNLAFIEQAVSYSFDCQISDKTFILPDKFDELVKLRLETLKKTNVSAHKLLCAAAILGDKISINLLKEIFVKDISDFDDTVSYLVKTNFIRQYDDVSYEFNNLVLWETILKTVTKDSVFDDINIKIGKVISLFNLNTNATMSMIAHNLRENRLAFEIWTKTTRLASYVGDINLYVIAQKQCLALLNEFKEEETVNIRYNICERLGKILTEYDPEEAMDYLPDAIAHAKEVNDEVKEIELLGYLTQCCQKIGNYFGNVECSDDLVKKLPEGSELEKAMILTSKLSALLDIGNCGEIINLVDNDILPVLNSNLSKPNLGKLFPLGILFDTWLKVHLVLATALALQGHERAFNVLKDLFALISKHKISDKQLISKAKLVLAYTYTVHGNFSASNSVLNEVSDQYEKFMDYNSVSRKNLICIINKFLQKDYTNIREELFDAVTFANNTGDAFTKNILKTLLGKVFKDENRAKHAIEIYNEQITYFAKEKIALGALLSWYLIADATIVTDNSKSSIDIAERALEIAKNPTIGNVYFEALLNLLLAKTYMNIADFQTAKVHLETALNISKKHKLNDTLSKVYLIYGKYYFEIGSIQSDKQKEYLRGALMMYERGMEIVVKETKNSYIKNVLTDLKTKLNDFCKENGFKL